MEGTRGVVNRIVTTSGRDRWLAHIHALVRTPDGNDDGKVCCGGTACSIRT